MAQQAQTVYNRRYISVKELIGYTLFDASKSIEVGYDTRFLYDVYKISLNKIAITNVINSIWDIVNDTFIGIWIDKTRTRWGKFRIYLLMMAVPGALLTIFRFLSPGFLSADPDDTTKFLLHLMFALVGEGFGTFRGISESGLFASLTPNPEDRVRLYSESQRISAIFDNLPGILMGVLIDLVNHNATPFSLQSLFATLGPLFCIISTAMAIYFFIIAKERVPQNTQTPHIKEGLTAVWRNKPMRLMLLCDLLGIFTIGTDQNNYYIDVLGYASLSSVVQAPAVPLSFLSYSFIPAARKRFENRTLWIVSSHMSSFLFLFVYLFGIIGGKGEKGNYNNWKLMVPALIVRDLLIKVIWGFQFVIPTEVFNETLDYCEWQDGYRAEGMILAAKGLIGKIVRNAFSWVGTAVMKAIGYQIGVGFGKQSQRVRYLIFFTSVFLPNATGLLSMIPKLFYPIDKQMRETMYRELYERRQRMITAAAQD